MKKRIKTRRLTNIYHSDDDDVGDGYNLLSPPLSLSFSLSLSLSLGPSPSSQDSCQLCWFFRARYSELLFLLATAKSEISLTLLLL